MTFWDILIIGVIYTKTDVYMVDVAVL